MFASILSVALGSGGLGLGHVVLGVIGTAFGYWLNNRAAPAAPSTLSQAIASVVPSAVAPAAHVSTLADLVAEAESDPLVISLVQGLLSQLGAQKTSAAQALLASVVARPNPAAAIAPVVAPK